MLRSFAVRPYIAILFGIKNNNNNNHHRSSHPSRMLVSRPVSTLLFLLFVFLSFLLFKRVFFSPGFKMATFHHVYEVNPVQEYETKVTCKGATIGIHVKEQKPSSDKEAGTDGRTSVLLLHGQRFHSGTWLELKTLERLAERGHRVVAVDLPGYGKSDAGADLNANDDKGTAARAEFLQALISSLSLHSPVLVSPSMSGSFSLPFLFRHPTGLRGFVPVAPVHTDKFQDEVYLRTRVPTLTIYGQLDTGLGLASLKKLKNLPDNKVVEIPNARHPAYLDGPDLFHEKVLEFLDRLDAEDLSGRMGM